jgi:hypothetical protein
VSVRHHVATGLSLAGAPEFARLARVALSLPQWGTRPVEEKNVFDFVFANPNRVPDDKVALVLGATGEKVTYVVLQAMPPDRSLAYQLRRAPRWSKEDGPRTAT